MFEEKNYSMALKLPIMLKMWNLLDFFARNYGYILFYRTFEKVADTNYILYLADDLETILLKEKETNIIISDKKFIKNILEYDYKNKQNNLDIITLSFFEKDFFRMKQIRDFIIDYFDLDIHISNDIVIDFTPKDVYHNQNQRRKEWEMYKKTRESHKILMQQIRKEN
jgi:hypothetical protein